MTVNHETNCLPENIARQIEQRAAGKRGLIRHGGALCSGCYAEPPVPGQRYGRECRRAASAAHYQRTKEELKRLRAAQGV